ncbi:heparan-alpha-glucosaminide N-acetyltransferase domain-containing protein [Rhodovulum steppense]|uniref:Uncharacterized protein DUF1624 n=1 Tax=Rhodovulum steppense TaxID=540251 RepID=A0A4V2R3X8_9RHOB|nr:heparan-alpha-glucosaminide N-acetyltransferase domain-containing protein [Rhodovulum steppense]TCM78988.1 uncharacterized protein DUF1624 [Rhodovulum steppense]
MRFVAIDQTRGLAIAAMIMAHFGPGVWERLGLEGLLLDVFLLIGRFATPTFIAIFGFTLAFAYVSKAEIGPAEVRAKLIRRSGFVLLAAIVVSFPSYVTTMLSAEHWGDSIPLNIILNTYGVLLFYSLAIFAAGLLIAPIARSPYIFPIIIGGMAVFFGTYLGYDAWSYQGKTTTELLRLFLVSGKYAFFVNFGLALMLVAFGWHIRKIKSSDRDVGPTLLVSGVVLLLLSLSIGRIVGWRSLAELHSGYDAPPQIWYLFAVCGVMFAIIACFDRVRIPFFSFFLEHTGRNPLAIYVAHAFVLPAVSAFRLISPGLPDLIHATLPLLIFFCYWTFVIWKSSRGSSNFRTAPA